MKIKKCFYFKRVQWDHIKFNHPVFLEQIRIVPKDCYISLKNGTNRFGLELKKKTIFKIKHFLMVTFIFFSKAYFSQKFSARVLCKQLE